MFSLIRSGSKVIEWQLGAAITKISRYDRYVR
jgi:hypothetical protein